MNKNNFQELADDEEGNEDSSTFYWESHLEMQQEDEKNNVYRRQNYHGEKKSRKICNDDLMEVHSYIQRGTSHVGGKVPSWKQISNVILEEQDSEENLVNNKNDFPEIRHAEPKSKKEEETCFPSHQRTNEEAGTQSLRGPAGGDPRRQQIQKEGDDYRRLRYGRVGHQRTKLPRDPDSAISKRKRRRRICKRERENNAQSMGKVGASEDQWGKSLRTETPGD